MRWLTPFFVMMLVACAGSPASEAPDPDASVPAMPDGATPDPDGAAGEPPAFTLRVDGRSVDCALGPRVRGVGPTAAVELELEEGAADARLSLEGEARAPGVWPVPEEGALLRLELGAMPACFVHLRRADADRAALGGLRSASTRPIRATWSGSTGALSNLTGAWPLGTTDVAALQAFVATHAPAFGVPAEQLLHSGSSGSTDGSQLHVFVQYVGGIGVFGAALRVRLDVDGTVRSLHSTLRPDVVEAPSHRRTLDEVRSAVGAPAEGMGFPVLYDSLAFGGGIDRELRAGWWIEREVELVLYDDESLLPRHAVEQADSFAVEVHTATYSGSGRSGFLAIGSTTAHLTGQHTDAAPVGTPRAEGEEALWRQMADVSSWVEGRFGHSGWATASQAFGLSGAPDLPAGTVRLISEPGSSDASWYASSGFMRIDPTVYAASPDVLCHEYGHVLDSLRGLGGEMSRHFTQRTFREAVADVFMVACERTLFAGDPWRVGETSARGIVRDIAADRPDWDREGMGRGNYGNTAYLTHALYRAVTRYGWSMDRGFDDMAWDFLAWLDPDDYAALRDQWLMEAAAHADAGRYGITHDDVCAMARGFRDVGLDGVYGGAKKEPAPDSDEYVRVCDGHEDEDGDGCWCDPCPEEGCATCEDASDCASCNAIADCGWCPERGCLPDALQETCEEDAWLGNPGACEPCDGLAEDACRIDPFCGWCPGDGTCLPERSDLAAECDGFEPL